MIDRIRQIMDMENLSPSQFADEIEIQRSSLSHVLSGRNKPSLDFVMKIKKCFTDVSLDWLLFGEGEMLPEPSKTYKITESNLFESDLPVISDEDQDEIAGNKEDKPVESGINEVIDNYVEKDRHQSKVGEIDKIVLLYTDGTFREYRK